MASDVDADCRGKNNNIGSMRHGLCNGTTNLPITDSEVLIESEFLELKSQLHYSKTVHILLTDEFVFVKEMRDRRDSEAHVLQYESGKIVTKFRRSDVSVKLCEGCPFTFKARWSKETSLWKTYELCGKDEVWPKWLRSFNVEEPLGQSMIPSKSICELECGSDSDDGSDDDDGEDVQIPEYSFPLSVDRTISMWSMASMSMLNPSNVRRLSRLSKLSRLSMLVSNSSSDDAQDVLNAGSLYRSNSHPRVSLVKPFRCCSLPHVGDLENVQLDSDLTKHACRTKGETSADESNHALNSAALLEREVGTPNKNTTLATLQQRVEKLRAHPSNLNFVRWGKGDNPPWDSLATPRHRRKHSLDVALTNEANRIPMPSDSGIRLGALTPYFSDKQEQAHENKMTSTLHETNKPETLLSPKKTNKLLSKRCESMPTSQRPDLSHVTHPVSGRGSKEGIAFKDDMAMELNDSSQAPRKDKIKRFWTIMYKKLPKLRMSTLESNDSVKETDNDVRSAEGSSLNVLDLDYPNGVNFAGNRRSGVSDITLATKDKISGILPSEETHKKMMQSVVQSKQGG